MLFGRGSCAGVGKQTVYARFKSKEDLFATVIHATAEQLVAPLASDRERSVRDTLVGVGHLGALLGIDVADNELQHRRRIASAVDAFLKIYS